MEDSHHINTW